MTFPQKNIQHHSFYSSLQKAMHLGSNPSLDHCGPNGNDARFITKAFCRDILGAHYRQPDLKVWLTLLITMLISRGISLKYMSCYYKIFDILSSNYINPKTFLAVANTIESFTHCSLSLKEVWPILRKVDKNNLSGSILVKDALLILAAKTFYRLIIISTVFLLSPLQFHFLRKKWQKHTKG